MQDHLWQENTSRNLTKDSKRLRSLLSRHHLSPDGGCAFFQWVGVSHAEIIHEKLLRQGVFTRLFSVPQSLRFGLPGAESEWGRLDAVLNGVANIKV